MSPVAALTEAQDKAIHSLAEQHSRVKWTVIDIIGRVQVDTDCDEIGTPTSSYIIEPDGRIHGV